MKAQATQPEEKSKKSKISNDVQDKVSTKDQLLHLTETAANKLKEMMEKEENAIGLRINLAPGGCSGFRYGLDFETKASDSDIVCEDFGMKVFVEKGLEAFLKGTTIDYVDTLEESGFKIDNPNAKSSCGCGKSDGF